MAEKEKVRLQKVIAEAGLGSRREVEAWIMDGLVTVNGKIAVLGEKVDPEDVAIKVRGKLIKLGAVKQATITLMMNKKRGVLCSNDDPFHEKTVFTELPKPYQKVKLFCAGRLDKNSEGLVILTNDGDLAQKITHPSHELVKRYQVKLSKEFDDKLIPKLLKGIVVDGEKLYAKKILHLQGRELEVHLVQGRKREIRRMFEALGYFVERLKRFQIGELALKKLPAGEVKLLTEKELSLLLKK